MTSRKNNVFQSRLEWESIEWPIEIYDLKSQNNNYSISDRSTLTVHRNDKFDLIGTMEGGVNHLEDLEYKINDNKPKVGQLVKGDTITGCDSIAYYKYTLNNFFINSFSFNLPGKSSDNKIEFNSQISIKSLEEKIVDDNREISLILEFYLTGKIKQLFPRSTDRIIEEKFSKSRIGIDPEIENPNQISWQSFESSRDYFYIETPEFNVIVQRVHNSFVPNWANGIQVEYRRNFDKIPDEETRKAVAEIIGFTLGTQFLKVGESQLDFDFKIITRKSNNPWGNNVVSNCKSPSLPPISFRDHNDKYKIERVLNKLIPQYLLYRKEYDLSNVIWKYWIFKELAIGTNLPILSSALESLAENYIKSKSLIKSYSKPEKEEYKNLINKEIESLTKKLTEYDFLNSVLNKIQNPFNLGAAEKMRLFFDNIGIHFNAKSIENEALKARNKMTHDSIKESDGEVKKYTKLSRAYQSLFNRTILKVLDFDEEYIDYFSVGYPNKKLNENI